MQSYNPGLPHYISPEAAAMLPPGVVVETSAPAPAIEATTEVAETAEPVREFPAAPLETDERIAALESRVSALEANAGKVEKAGEILAWADKVLNKYYTNASDKPEVQPLDFNGDGIV